MLLAVFYRWLMDPIPSATVIIARDGSDGIEVVMGRRPPGGVFGGLWVFPGGALETIDVDPEPDRRWRLAALRETAEEVGIFATNPPGVSVTVDGNLHDALAVIGARFAVERLLYLSHWVTPVVVPKRFDTRFYLLVLEAGDGEPTTSNEFELVAWVNPPRVLADPDHPMIFPTEAHLRYVAEFARVADLVAAVEATPDIPTIEPRMFERDGRTAFDVIHDRRFR